MYEPFAPSGRQRLQKRANSGEGREGGTARSCLTTEQAAEEAKLSIPQSPQEPKEGNHVSWTEPEHQSYLRSMEEAFVAKMFSPQPSLPNTRNQTPHHCTIPLLHPQAAALGARLGFPALHGSGRNASAEHQLLQFPQCTVRGDAARRQGEHPMWLAQAVGDSLATWQVEEGEGESGDLGEIHFIGKSPASGSPSTMVISHDTGPIGPTSAVHHAAELSSSPWIRRYQPYSQQVEASRPMGLCEASGPQATFDSAVLMELALARHGAPLDNSSGVVTEDAGALADQPEDTPVSSPVGSEGCYVAVPLPLPAGTVAGDAGQLKPVRARSWLSLARHAGSRQEHSIEVTDAVMGSAARGGGSPGTDLAGAAPTKADAWKASKQGKGVGSGRRGGASHVVHGGQATWHGAQDWTLARGDEWAVEGERKRQKTMNEEVLDLGQRWMGEHENDVCGAAQGEEDDACTSSPKQTALPLFPTGEHEEWLKGGQLGLMQKETGRKGSVEGIDSGEKERRRQHHHHYHIHINFLNSAPALAETFGAHGEKRAAVADVAQGATLGTTAPVWVTSGLGSYPQPGVMVPGTGGAVNVETDGRQWLGGTARGQALTFAAEAAAEAAVGSLRGQSLNGVREQKREGRGIGRSPHPISRSPGINDQTVPTQ